MGSNPLGRAVFRAGLWGSATPCAGDTPTLQRGAQRHRQCLGCHCHCHQGGGTEPGTVQPCPGAGSDRDRGAFISIYQPLSPQLQSRGLPGGLQEESGCDSGVWGSRFPLLSPGEGISSTSRSVPRGTFQVFLFCGG